MWYSPWLKIFNKPILDNNDGYKTIDVSGFVRVSTSWIQELIGKNLQETEQNFLSYEVTIEFYMFCLFMKGWIRGNVDNNLIVTK